MSAQIILANRKINSSEKYAVSDKSRNTLFNEQREYLCLNERDPLHSHNSFLVELV